MIYNATQAELEGEDRRTWTEQDTDRRKVLEKSFHCVLGHGDFLKKIEVSSHDEEIQEESVCVCVCLLHVNTLKNVVIVLPAPAALGLFTVRVETDMKNQL